MENNAFIRGTFAHLINILEPRTRIDVFEVTEDGGQCIVYCSKPVYSLYHLCDVTCEDKHGDYKVIGLTMGIHTTVLIQKGE